MGDHQAEDGRLQSVENQVCPKSKTGVPVAPKMVVHWSQVRDCDGCYQKMTNSSDIGRFYQVIIGYRLRAIYHGHGPFFICSFPITVDLTGNPVPISNHEAGYTLSLSKTHGRVVNNFDKI